MTLAPIVLFVYNRPWHTRQTIEALQKNELADASELFIYSDAAKNEQAETAVAEVRQYIKSIDGFRNITIIEREQNWGLADSIIDGVTNILRKYEKAIILEDDLITSPPFLRFMNDALEFYDANKEIMSISGYTLPFILPRNYLEEVFVFYRGSSWGWATWIDRWNLVDFKVSDYKLLLKSKVLQKKFNRGGSDLFNMLQMQMEGKIDSWAIRFAYAHSKNDKYSLLPTKSLVKNIGHDGSGTHCGQSNDWNVSLYDKKPECTHVSVNPYIVKNIQQHLKTNHFKRVYKKLSSIIGL